MFQVYASDIVPLTIIDLKYNASALVNIRVKDVNDNAPRFTQGKIKYLLEQTEYIKINISSCTSPSTHTHTHTHRQTPHPEVQTAVQIMHFITIILILISSIVL